MDFRSDPDLPQVEVHPPARLLRQTERAVGWHQRMGQEVLVDRVPLHQVFLVWRQDRRLRQRGMQPGRRGMPVRDHDQVVDRGMGRDLQGFGQAAGPVDVGLEDIERLGVDEALKPQRVYSCSAPLSRICVLTFTPRGLARARKAQPLRPYRHQGRHRFPPW